MLKNLSTEPVCDFCGAPRPKRLFPAHDTAMPVGGLSTGAWASCEPCGLLIDLNDKAGLIRYVTFFLQNKYDGVINADLITWGVKESVERFWRARI